MQARQTITTQTTGNFTYTLLGIEQKGEMRYSISATDGQGIPCYLENFTDNNCLAEAYLTLLARNAVDPHQIRDVWEDMQIV